MEPRHSPAMELPSATNSRPLTSLGSRRIKRWLSDNTDLLKARTNGLIPIGYDHTEGLKRTTNELALQILQPEDSAYTYHSSHAVDEVEEESSELPCPESSISSSDPSAQSHVYSCPSEQSPASPALPQSNNSHQHALEAPEHAITSATGSDLPDRYNHQPRSYGALAIRPIQRDTPSLAMSPSLNVHPLRSRHHINLATATHRPEISLPRLPCELHAIGGCPAVFKLNQTDDWIEHIVKHHLRNNIPEKTTCWFCQDVVFGRDEFDLRMRHIRDHMVERPSTAKFFRPDDSLIEHMVHHDLIDLRVYASAFSRSREIDMYASQWQYLCRHSVAHHANQIVGLRELIPESLPVTQPTPTMSQRDLFLMVVFMNLCNLFARAQAGAARQHAGGSSTTPEGSCDTKAETSDKPGSTKRKSSNGFERTNGDEDDGNGDDQRKRRRKPRIPKGKEKPVIRFACPWFKYDPMAYQKCNVIQPSSYQGVREHVIKYHLEPSEFECSTCESEFLGEEDLEEHHKQIPRCSPVAMSKDKKRKALKNLGREKLDAEKCKMLRDIVCPDAPKDQTPYTRDIDHYFRVLDHSHKFPVKARSFTLDHAAAAFDQLVSNGAAVITTPDARNNFLQIMEQLSGQVEDPTLTKTPDIDEAPAEPGETTSEPEGVARTVDFAQDFLSSALPYSLPNLDFLGTIQEERSSCKHTDLMQEDRTDSLPPQAEPDRSSLLPNPNDAIPGSMWDLDDPNWYSHYGLAESDELYNDLPNLQLQQEFDSYSAQQAFRDSGYATSQATMGNPEKGPEAREDTAAMNDPTVHEAVDHLQDPMWFTPWTVGD